MQTWETSKRIAKDENGWTLRAFDKERMVSMEVKKRDCDGIIVLTITYTRETRVWNERQR